MKKANSILIIGGGRMGLSHGLICSALIKKSNIAFVEKSMLARIMLRGLAFTQFKNITEAYKARHFTHAIITTPTGAHLPVVKEILEFGVNALFIEKPLSSSIEQSKEIFSLTQKQNCVVQMGYVYRFNPIVLRLKSILLAEKYGPIESYKMTLLGNVVTGIEGAGNNWRCNDELGGGVLRDFGSHLIDLSCFLFGTITDVKKVRRTKILSVDVEDQCFFNLFHLNIDGSIKVDWCDHSCRKTTLSVTIQCTKGKIELRGNEVYVTKKDGLGAILLASNLSTSVGFYLRGEEFSLQMEHFLKLREMPEHALGASIKDGVLVDQIIDRIRGETLQHANR